MRNSIIAGLFLALVTFASASGDDESRNSVTPSKLALDFINTVFLDRNAERVSDFCHLDAKRHRKLDDGESVAKHLEKTILNVPTGDSLRLKHMHVFREADINEDFLKLVMPTVQEADLVASFKPFTDAMKGGFCCVVVFDVVVRNDVRPYMFTFAFSPAGKSYKIVLMDEGAPR